MIPKPWPTGTPQASKGNLLNVDSFKGLELELLELSEMSSSSSSSEYMSAREWKSNRIKTEQMNLETDPIQGCIRVVTISLEIPLSTFSKLKFSSDRTSSQALSSSLPQEAWKPSGGRSALSESSLFRLAPPLLLLLRLAFSKVSCRRNSTRSCLFSLPSLGPKFVRTYIKMLAKRKYLC